MSSAHQIAFNILTIIAIFTGPIAAIQIQELLEKRREQRRSKVNTFRELMVTRSTILSPRHVQALNAIQMEFSARRADEKPIVDAWQLYISHLNTPSTPETAVEWNTRAHDLLTDLLFQMAIVLGYTDINKARIKNESYVPQYFSEIENEQNELRKSAIQVFKGNQALSVRMAEEVAANPKMYSEPPLMGRIPKDPSGDEN